MPFVEGESLRARLARDGSLPIADVVRILRDVAEALSYAHERGIVHRDIKPDNILLARHHALVTDFGVAKAVSASTDSTSSPSLTGIGTTLGTPAYMAPEQASGDTTDHRSDIYALGVLAYEMLTGQQMFAGRSPQQTMMAHVTQMPEPVTVKRPETPAPLAALVMRMLAKVPSERPQSADEVLTTLDALTTPGATPALGAVNRLATRRVWSVAAVLLVVVLLGAVVARARATRGGAPATRVKSLAVLPFINLSGDVQNDYLSDGISEQLIDALSRVKTLQVAARTSSFAFRGKNEDIRVIAAKLGVANVLAGSVRRVGNRLRVTAQLTSADNGFNIWSETFDRQFSDVLAVQDEINGAIVAALSGVFAGSDPVAPAVGTTNVAAYDAFLKGKYNWNRRGREGLTLAARFFRDAITQDPNYASAHAYLAQTYLSMANWSFISARAGADSGLKYAKRAVSLDDRAADGHAALATQLCQHSYDFSGADREYRRAIELNPGDAQARYFYAWCLAGIGRLDSGIIQARRAHDLDRLNAQIYSALGKAYYLRRQYREGLDMYREVDDMPDVASVHYWRSKLSLMLSETRNAVTEGARGVEMSSGSPLYLTVYAQALAAAGQSDSALRVIHRLERLPGRASYGIAQFYARTRDERLAVAWVDSAATEGSDWTPMLALDQDFDAYRAHPKVAALIRRLGLSGIHPDSTSGTLK
jgi:serine/threonine-protein kinase